MTLTPRGQTATVLAVTAFLIGGPWLATITGNILTGNTEAPVQRQGEGRQIGTPEAAQTPAIPAPPRATPTRAARTRPTTPPVRKVSSGRVLSVTCYCWTGNRTASGVWPAPGQAASNLYPFGTRLRVPGVGIVTVTDRVGHSSDLDLYFTSRSDCLRFGRQSLRVEVISRG